MTQLNEQQIASLFDFTKSKYVRYIDVQHELVDHLATDIEIEMNGDDSLTFDTALIKVYGKFPISGFSKFVSQSEHNMHVFWGKLILRQFLLYAGLPFIIVLALLVLIQYKLLIFFGLPCVYGLLILVVAYNFWASKKFHNLVKFNDENLNESYLVVSVFRGFGLGFSFFPIMFSQIVGDFTRFSTAINENYLQFLLLSILLSLGWIWSAMTYYRFPKLIRKVLNDKYAHLKLSV